MSFAFKGRTIRKVGVVGSGQIGPDIALYFSKVLSPYGVEVVVVDVVEEALAKGRGKVEAKVRKGVETGAFSPEQERAMLEALAFTTDYGALSGAELVVEAATEDAGLKQNIFQRLEEVCGEGALLASNSSHLEPEVIFEKLRRKERAMVIHYFFPAERNMVVEVVPGAATSEEETAFVMALYEALGKAPIRVGSRYGYALDPIFEGLFLAAALLVEEGAGTTREVDAVAREALGLGVGPFTAMNLTGGNPITKVGLAHYREKLHPWYRVPESLEKAVAEKRAWEVPVRGEKVEVPPERAARIAADMRAAYFGLACEVLDSGITNLADLDMALELALDAKPAFRFMDALGTEKALGLVKDYARRQHNFPVARSLQEKGERGEPWKVPFVLRRDVDDTTVVTIRRPRVLNALDREVFTQLHEVFTAVKEDEEIASAVLTGFGVKAFVSGADVRFLAAIRTPEEGERTSLESQEVLDSIEDLGKPVVCALNGVALGGGNELAMACTARICRSGLKALAGQPEVNLGILPGAGGTQRLPRLVGIEKAAEMLRTGRTVSSREAVEMGLCLEEVEGDLVERAVALAQEIAAGKREAPPMPRDPLPDVPDTLPEADLGHLSRAVDRVLCKATLEGARLPLHQGLALEARCFGEVCALKDMRIGVENFLKNGPRSKAPFVHA